MRHPKTLLVVVLALCGAASFFTGGINPYYYDILITIGINILLAVSLNLVIGYTGQFSLGHAGFMAVGAYSSSWLTLTFGAAPGASALASAIVFFLALLAGGFAA